MKEIRPKIKIAFGASEKILLVLTIAAHLLLWAVVVFAYSKLHEIVPTHFNFKGEADHYGGREILFLFPAISLVLTISFLLLSRIPHVYNYPINITEFNAGRLYRQGTRFMLSITLMLNLMFLSFEIMMVTSMFYPLLNFPVWQVLIPVAIFVGVLFLLIRKMKNTE